MFPARGSAHKFTPKMCSYHAKDELSFHCLSSTFPPQCFLPRKKIFQVPLFMDKKTTHTIRNVSTWVPHAECSAGCLSFIHYSSLQCLCVVIVQIWAPRFLIQLSNVSHLQSKCWFGWNSECLRLSNTTNGKGRHGHFCLPQERKDPCCTEAILLGELITL